MGFIQGEGRTQGTLFSVTLGEVIRKTTRLPGH